MLYMLKIFLVTRCREYTYGTLAAILVLLHLRDIKHPVYDSLEMFPGLLNEEPGEISLGVLARLQPSTQVQQSQQLMSENYQLIPRLSRVTATMESICGISNASGYMTIKPTGGDLSSAVEFFRKTIRELRSKQFRHYTGDPSSWVDYQRAMASADNKEPEPYLPVSSAALLRDAHRKWLVQLRTRWIRESVVAHLPGFEQFARQPERKARLGGDEKIPPSDDEPSDHGWSEDETPPLVPPPPLPPLPPAVGGRPQQPDGADRKLRAPSPPPARRGRARGGRRRSRTSLPVDERKEQKAQTAARGRKRRADAPARAPVAPSSPVRSASGRVRRATAPRPGFFEITRGWVTN